MAAPLARLLARYQRLAPISLCKRASSTVSYPLELSTVSADHAALYEESLQNPEGFWGDLARRRLHWFKEFDQVMDCDMEQGRISWFNGGKINVSGSSSFHALYSMGFVCLFGCFFFVFFVFYSKCA